MLSGSGNRKRKEREERGETDLEEEKRRRRERGRSRRGKREVGEKEGREKVMPGGKRDVEWDERGSRQWR